MERCTSNPWIAWPDKATYEATATKMETDERWKAMPEMPFDGKRMMWAGFEPLFESGSCRRPRHL